jgi:two-component system, chemotaxis family, protein-glutamate methylesterase/glutaminase
VAHRDILAIGTSAGGFDALTKLARGFPANLPAAVLVVIHLPGHFRSTLDELLTRTGPLAASFAADGEPLKHGHIYIGPPERHLLVNDDRLILGTGPRENNARPAIDPMLRSLALCCGPRSIGVILTGTLGDGAAGLLALRDCGGIAVVQDPNDAAYAEMPATALSKATPDYVAGLEEMPALLKRLIQEPVGKVMPIPESLKYEVAIAANGHAGMTDMDRLGRRSVLACPDCHGVLWEIDDGTLVRYRCHVGHAYTAEAMSVALDDGLRRALGSALRALDERVALAQRLQSQASGSHRTGLAEDWARKACEFESEAQTIRDSIARIDEIAARSARQPK